VSDRLIGRLAVRERGDPTQAAILPMGLAAMIGSEVTPALQAFVRDVFAEVDGEVCQRARPDEMADHASPLIKLRVVEGWYHSPILQDPERASSVIVDWLRAHLYRAQPGYSSLRQARGSADPAFGVRASRNAWYGATNGSGACTV
jgi:hypothetical protein